MSVCLSAWNKSALTGWFLMKFDIWDFFNSLKNQVSLKPDKNNGYFTWRAMYIYEKFLLNSSQNDVTYKICRENQNRYYMFNCFFQKLFHLWDDVEKYYRAGRATDVNMVYVYNMLRLQTHSQNM
jgi:hypothetical protein